MKTKKTGQPLKCLRCGYQWPPRQKHPRACPACKSYRWKEPRVTTANA